MIIIGSFLALMLIIPIFLPSTAEVTCETEIALEPARIFPMVASYSDRAAWDPWVETDSTARVTVESKPGYVGSTYQWDGMLIGKGTMEVLSVEENSHIESSLMFEGMKTPSKVTWDFNPSGGGTRVVWSYSQDAGYPFQRLGMVLGKIFLKKSFDHGLSNLKTLLENPPPTEDPLSAVSIGEQGLPKWQAPVTWPVLCNSLE